ncbi:MAG: tetratricopeptide repeat protein [Proteobacteria bacterium]|nr:tetratricopeptide repeat protein [Pseudomonadota bacterium]
MRRNKYWHSWIVCLGLLVINTIVYSNTLHSPFVFDDKDNIVNNSFIRLNELSFQNLSDAAFKSNLPTRPVANISFALNYYLGGYQVWGYHLVNISIHLMTAIVLFYLFRITIILSAREDPIECMKSNTDSVLTKQQVSNHIYNPGQTGSVSINWVPFMASLLWMVHPVHTQAVTYIVQRMTSLAAMFFILSVFFYAKGRIAQINKKDCRLFFAGCLISGLLAMGSKEIAAMLPVFILLYEWYFFQNLSFAWLRRNIVIFIIVILFIGLLSFIYLGENPIHRILSFYAKRDFTMTQRIYTQFRVVIFYVGLLIYPHPSRLSLEHDFPISSSLLDPISTLLSMGLIMSVLLLSIKYAKKEKILSFGIFWFIGNLLIESSVIGLEIIFEHRLYLSSMFISLAVVYLIFRAMKSGRLAYIFLVSVVLIFSVWSHQRNNVWKDAITFWQDSTSKSPNKSRPHNNLGIALAEKGQPFEAITQYQMALAINPNYVSARMNLGYELFSLGKANEAIAHYKKVLSIKPDHFYAHFYLGRALILLGKYEEAAEHYSKALASNPKSADVYNNMGNLFLIRGDFKKAAEYYQKAIQLDSQHTKAFNGLGSVLTKIGKFDEAAILFKEALRINPDDEAAKTNLDLLLNRKTNQSQ